MVITLAGDDNPRLESRLRSLLSEHLPDDASAFNLSELDGSTVTVDELRATCDALPFMGGARVVVVRGLLRRFADKDGDEGSTKAADASFLNDLKGYLPLVPDSTVLIFLERRRLGAGPAAKALRGSTQVEEYNLPTEDELPGYIQSLAKREGMTVDREAARLLALAVADDPNRLEPELGKLMAYKLEDPRITERDVRLLVEVPLDVAVWDLTDAMFRHDARASVQALRSLLERGQAPQQVMGAIASQYRNLVAAEEYRGSAPDRLASATGMKPFSARKALGALRNFQRGEPQRVLRALCELDERVKTGRAELESALELLIVEACSRKL